MNEPIDHHYLPVFYLEKWCGRGGKVIRFFRPKDVVVAGPISPSRTGFEPHLYSLRGLPSGRGQMLETDYFSREVDSPGARALRVLLARERKKLTPELRMSWTRFLMAMPLRGPHSLAELNLLASRNLRENLSTLAGEEYEAARKAEDSETLYDWAVKNVPDHLDNIYKTWLPGLIDHQAIGTHIMNMTWTVLDLSTSRYPLLTGDRPYMTTHGLSDPRAVLAFPLSPTDLFIAANNPLAWRSFEAQGMTETARRANDWICRLAVKHVYGDTSRAIHFVEERLIGPNDKPIPGIFAK